jgi:hypothetical protein
MKTLYVHIGAHKTGSTSLQHLVSWYRPLLRLAGLDVPRMPGSRKARNQDIAIDALAHRHDRDFATRGAYLDHVRRSNARRFFVSAERLYVNQDAPAYFAPFKDICIVKIICFVRRQDRFLEAMYRQLVRNNYPGLTIPFPDFAAKRSVDWSEKLTPWEDEFGRANVIVIPYDDHRAFDSISAISEIAGLGVLRWLPIRPKANPGLSCEATETLRHLREQEIAFDLGKLAAFDARLPARTYLYFDPAGREHLLEGYRASNTALARNHNFDLAILNEIDAATKARTDIFNLAAFDLARHLELARACGLMTEGRGKPKLDKRARRRQLKESLRS